MIEALLDTVRGKNPIHAKMLDHAVASLTDAERDLLGRYIAFCNASGSGVEKLASAYNLIVHDTFREELFFRRHGRYRHSTYADVADAVYQNPEYMRDYMHGLAVTGFLWPNHIALRRFYDRLIDQAAGGCGYLEIGPGHGVFMARAMHSRRWQSFTGIDISPTSLQMTRSVLESGMFGNLDGYQLIEGDFLRHTFSQSFDAIVMGEVLEHVEHPLAFLQRIRDLASPEAFLFVSTCINAPAVDHISNFLSPKHLEELFGSAGLQVVDSLVVPYHGKSIVESLDERLSINVAYSLKRIA